MEHILTLSPFFITGLQLSLCGHRSQQPISSTCRTSTQRTSCTMQSCTYIAAILLVCASVHAQDTISSAAVEGAIEAQAIPAGAAAPKHYGRPTCNRVLPGCKKCIMYYVKQVGKAKSSTATAAATPDHFDRIRKVYVCTECMTGYNLTGTGKMSDPKPKYCVKAGNNTGWYHFAYCLCCCWMTKLCMHWRGPGQTRAATSRTLLLASGC